MLKMLINFLMKIFHETSGNSKSTENECTLLQVNKAGISALYYR